MTAQYPYLEKLNPAQYEAATTIQGKVFILAGAGSGKTATLTARTTYMIDNSIAPENILLLTFTNKAAKEMRDRIAASVGEKAQKITATTFHSFCAMFLRANARLIGRRNDFTIIDSPDMVECMNLAKQDFLNENNKDKKYDLKDFSTAKSLARVYEMSINNCVSLDEAIDSLNNLAAYRREILDIIARFKTYKDTRNLMDYDDLLYYAEKILAENESLRRHVGKQYAYISCDEYQDTNTVQNNILSYLAEECGNLAVVGDDNQSIYAFRFANIGNILNFEARYPDCKTIVLDTNYRSCQEILDFSNQMMEYATEGKQKTLKGITKGKKPHLIVVNDCDEEARFIVKTIMERMNEYKLSDMAVICRSSNQSFILENLLRLYNIPFNKFGGLKFMEKTVIKNLLSFLRISVNPSDEIAMFRVLQLYQGIGKTFAQKISQQITESDIETAIQKYKRRNFFPGLTELQGVLKDMMNMCLDERMNFLIDTYYFALVEKSIKNGTASDSSKSEMLHALQDDRDDANILREMANKYKDTQTFLTDIVLDATNEKDDEDKLNITTIHSAKGLEYSIVFVMDCIEGITPRCAESDEENAEELRCMYVAVTRAKKELYLMVPQYYNIRKMEGILSHFISKENIAEATQPNVSPNTMQRMLQTAELYQKSGRPPW